MANLTVNGHQVKAWTISIIPGDVLANATTIVVPVSPITAGDSAEVVLYPRDRFGNSIPSNREIDFNGTSLRGPAVIEAVTGAIRSAPLICSSF